MTTPAPTELTLRAEPFDAIAESYDDHFTRSLIGKAQRQAVWEEMDCHFRPGQRILEINCGTGVDAEHLASRGVRVVACDSSPGMIAVARRNMAAWSHLIDLHVLPTERIGQLAGEPPFDGVLSNFAGLNCVEDLASVARDLARLVRRGGKAVLCVFGRRCLWEILWFIIQARTKRAFRRVSDQGVTASLAPGHSVVVRYPSLRFLRQQFAPHFRLRNWKGVGIAVPPSYLEHLALRHSRLLRGAERLDRLLGRYYGFRALADHVVLVLERSET